MFFKRLRTTIAVRLLHKLVNTLQKLFVHEVHKVVPVYLHGPVHYIERVVNQPVVIEKTVERVVEKVVYREVPVYVFARKDYKLDHVRLVFRTCQPGVLMRLFGRGRIGRQGFAAVESPDGTVVVNFWPWADKHELRELIFALLSSGCRLVKTEVFLKIERCFA